MIRKHLEAQQYETILNEFSAMRSIISGVFCIVFGLLVDILRRRLYKSPSSEILVLVVPYVLIVTCFAIFSIFLLYIHYFQFLWPHFKSKDCDILRTIDTINIVSVLSVNFRFFSFFGHHILSPKLVTISRTADT